MSASTSAITLLLCPHCQAPLAGEGVAPRQRLRCARCRGQFLAPGKPAQRPIHRRAVASFVWGLLSVLGLCLTGVPAIVLGILALGEIRRNPGKMRGQGLAVAGISLGAVFAVIGVMVALSVGWMHFVMDKVQIAAEPEDVARMTENVITWTLPPNVEPIRGVNAFATTQIVYGDQAEPPSIRIGLYRTTGVRAGQEAPPKQGRRIHELEQRQELLAVKNTQTLGRRTLTAAIEGQGQELTENTFQDTASREIFRQYAVSLPTDDGVVHVLMMVRGAKTEGNDPAFPLEEDQVLRFYESLALRRSK